MRRSGAGVLALMAAVVLAGCSGAQPQFDGSMSPTPRPEVVAHVSATPDVSPSVLASPSEAAPSAPGESQLAGSATQFFDAPNQADAAVQSAQAGGRGEDASLLARIADRPTATWIGGWTGDPTSTVSQLTHEAAARDEVALLVVYNIPGRDCGLHSAGGAAVDQYLGWIDQVAAGVAGGSVTWVILEPDALAQMGDCDGQGDRAALLASAAERLDAAGARVFLDAGHSNWRSVEDTAARMHAVGTAHLAGFATNTSNYNALEAERAWGDAVGSAVGLPYVTDTSRNGNGSDGQWCNPRGRGLGAAPALEPAALAAGSGMVATVWAKVPGESDGTCNGGPAAGQWWEEIALELARNAPPS